jgi:predicted nucleic acid-binding protein
MKALVFDSGPVISFALNGILDLIPFLKLKYHGEFYISNEVKKELIDNPLGTKRYAFEALMVGRLLKKNHLTLYDSSEYSDETEIVTSLANNIFYINDRPLRILDMGELDSLVLAKNIDAEAIIVDERTTRLLIEDSLRLHKMLEQRHRLKIRVDKEKLSEFRKHFSSLKIIRSVELALVGIDYGFFDDMINSENKSEVVKSLLWALKMNGCAISDRDIGSLIKVYR